jgi:hypothetical protein
VSQLWRDHIQVFIAPERVDLVRVSRSIKRLGRPVQAPRITLSCERDSDQPAWEPPVRKFESLMKEAANTEITITLSNHFIRYVTLPPQTEITKPSEVDAYAIFCLREIYGERADNWKRSVSAWNPLGGAVCAAIDTNLIEQLEEITKRYRIKLKNIEPYLTSVFDSCKQKLHGPRIYFALVETGRICIALLINGIWQNIRNQRILNCVEKELLVALDQEAILYGQREIIEQVNLFAPENPRLKLPVGCSWRITSLQPKQFSKRAIYPFPEDKSGKVNQCVA